VLTLRHLLILAAAVAATAVAAAAILTALQGSSPAVRVIATSILAEKPARADASLALRHYLAYYRYEGMWVLAEGPAGVPVYALGLGVCPGDIRPLLNRAYTRQNAIIHLAGCSLVMPWAEDGVIAHYVATCGLGSDFRPEPAELELVYQGRPVRVRVVLVNC
jgi:hypothetical protein